MFGESDGDSLSGALRLGAEIGLGHRLSHGGWVPPAQVLNITNSATIGAVLFKPVSINYTSMATASNKLWEFAARGIPVIVPDTPDFRNALGSESWIAFFKIGDPRTLAAGVERLTRSFEAYRAAALRAYEVVRSRYNFEEIFPPVLNSLIAAARSNPVCQ